jgi:pilus assembly protein CpaE
MIVKVALRKRDNVMDATNENMAGKKGQMIVVGGAKGGVGKTILSVNLAVALAKRTMKVCIIDGDFQFGDVNLALDIQETYTIKDAIEAIGTLDEATMPSFLTQHISGVDVLVAPERPEYADMITEESLQKITSLLLNSYDFVIVDTGVGLYENSLPFLDRADKLLLVTNLEMATIKNTKRIRDTLDMLGFGEKVEFIINRSTMESVLKAEDVSEILRTESPYMIPNDFKVVSRSFNMGMPLVQGRAVNAVTKAIFKMAEHIVSDSTPQMEKPKGRLFGLR